MAARRGSSAPAGTWRVVFARAAERDFEAIIGWTRDKFGARQARVYSRHIAAAAKILEFGPDVPGVRKRPDIGDCIFTLSVARRGRAARHLLVCRSRRDCVIEIVNILHESMDMMLHLGALDQS